MKTLIQKIVLQENESFACRNYRTPNFETVWHKHEEFEIIMITEGSGTTMIGDKVGEYKVGDVFFLKAGLPHWFKKSSPKMHGSAIVVHFRKDCFGDTFWNIPEAKKINRLLQSTNDGFQLYGKLQTQISKIIVELEAASGMQRIFQLVRLLEMISESRQYHVITKAFNQSVLGNEDATIETIMDFSIKHFLEPITLTQVAQVADMTIPTFCRYFKRNIKKSYFDFLKELRVGHACKLLRETNESILQVCYNSGYNSWAHFSKQFKQVKHQTPKAYRKEFSMGISE